MKKYWILFSLCVLLSGCSKNYYHYNDAISFRLENDSDQKLYAAAVSFGTEDTTFGSLSGENADGSALKDHGKDVLVFPIEMGDLNDTNLSDMVFGFYVGIEKDADFVYIGSLQVNSDDLHHTYTIHVKEIDGQLKIESDEEELTILPIEE